jgi:SNF2 family DNA or RNA helicase
MTPYELVTKHYTLPFPLYDFQVAAVNELAPLNGAGVYLEPGLGKTAVSTCCALYKRIREGVKTTLVIMPPILVQQWNRWLEKVVPKEGAPLHIVSYQGSPKHRAALDLNSDFLLMGIQIFKKDYDNIVYTFQGESTHVILDEASSIKDIGTGNYKLYRNFVQSKSHQLLTGTPLNNPGDAYAYIKLVAPTLYRSHGQFTSIHVTERDFFNNPKSYGNLDLLASNLKINAVRHTKADVLDLPPCTIVHMEYDLDPKHKKLYNQLATEQMLRMEDGSKIDATQSSALFHNLQQIICQWDFFGQDEKLVSNAYKLIEETLEEMKGAKLVVFANYRRTNQALVKRFNCPGVWGEVSPRDKEAAIHKFITDDTCNMIALNAVSAGIGIDGLQDVCADALYVESPISLSHWTQSMSRLDRQGQKKPVTIRIGTALGTIQEYLVKALVKKEDLVKPLQGSKALLRLAVYGDTYPLRRSLKK